jgi:3-hydroxyisobutyrate dehydrogenase
MRTAPVKSPLNDTFAFQKNRTFMSTKRIGWIGLGNMGTPMVKNLIKAGFDVTVYNRTASKTTSLQEAGAKVAVHAGELWSKADTIITMVADDAAVKEIYLGKGGLLTAAPAGKAALAGKTAIDMSTVSPDTSRELATLLAEKGVDYLDAPVAGSVKPAELGQLVIMAGGKKAVYEAALPIFERLGKASFLMGDQGAGNSAKLATNLLLAFNMQGLSEAVLFAQEKGIAPQEMLAVINESALANGITKGKTTNIVNQDFTAAFALKHLAKDLRLAKAQGLHTPGGDILHDSFQQALADGFGDEDIAAILPFLSGAR